MACGDRVVTFQGHHSYIVSIAKLCKENGLFTDVTIMCDDGKLKAHRIVLAAVSPFLCSVLEGETIGGGQTTIVVPEVRKEIVHQLLDFLYTGVMKLSQSATWELQQLVLLLQIDPQNVGVDTISVGLDSGKTERLADSVCQTLGIKIAHRVDIPTKMSPKQSPRTPKLSPTVKMSPKTMLPKVTSPKVYRTPVTSPPISNGIREKPESPTSSPSYSPVRVSTPGTAMKVSTPGSRSSNVRGRGQVSGRGRGERGVVSAGRGVNTIKISMGARKRTASNSRSSTESDTFDSSLSKSGDITASTTMSVLRQENNSNVIKIVTNRKRRSSAEAPKYSELDDDIREGPKRGRGVKARGRSSRRGRGAGTSTGRVLKGLHDLENTTTWVCAICGQYDPILPGSISRDGDTTEWIGCDCNRWFHKFCTRLKEVDDSFSCRHVHKSCLAS